MQTNEELKAEIAALKSQNKNNIEKIEQLEKLNKWYEDQLKSNRKKMFGASSERNEYEGYEQLNLFNEAEAERVPISEEPTVETITYKRKKKKGSREKLLAQLPVEVIEYKLDDTSCPKCDNGLHVMSKEVRKELKIVPAKVSVIEHVSFIYACRNCEKNDIKTPIIKADSPKGLIPKSLVSPSVVAYIMNQKFVNAMPLYRQEQEFKRMGVLLSRQTLSNWVIKCAQMLEPIISKMKQELLSKEVLHADETVLEVLHEPGRPAKMNSYMWLYRTSECDVPVVLYDYTEGRSGEYPKKYLNGFNGYLHTDGFAGYHKLEPEITLCGCFAHARRKFKEALDVSKNNSSLEAKGFAYINKLFEIEKAIKDESPEKRLEIRLKKSRPILEEFYEFVDNASDRTLPKSLLGSALGYAQNQKKYLISFLKDGRVELSNNRAERSIKPFVIGRKNWLFCNTPSGAKSSSVIYSVIETAKENNLKPFEYLKFVFEQLQENQLTDASELLPWSDTIPENLKMKL